MAKITVRHPNGQVIEVENGGTMEEITEQFVALGVLPAGVVATETARQDGGREIQYINPTAAQKA